MEMMRRAAATSSSSGAWGLQGMLRQVAGAGCGAAAGAAWGRAGAGREERRAFGRKPNHDVPPLKNHRDWPRQDPPPGCFLTAPPFEPRPPLSSIPGNQLSTHPLSSAKGVLHAILPGIIALLRVLHGKSECVCVCARARAPTGTLFMVDARVAFCCHLAQRISTLLTPMSLPSVPFLHLSISPSLFSSTLTHTSAPLTMMTRED